MPPASAKNNFGCRPLCCGSVFIWLWLLHDHNELLLIYVLQGFPLKPATNGLSGAELLKTIIVGIEVTLNNNNISLQVPPHLPVSTRNNTKKVVFVSKYFICRQEQSSFIAIFRSEDVVVVDSSYVTGTLLWSLLTMVTRAIWWQSYNDIDTQSRFN